MMYIYGIKNPSDYGIVIDGTKRYYLYDLANKGHDLEFTTPKSISIDEYVIEEHSWVGINTLVVDYLISLTGKTREELLAFRCDWTKKQIFSTENKTNHRSLECGLFLNCNHTALRSCWLLSDLLAFFDVSYDRVKLVIHRAPASEPSEVREIIEGWVRAGYKDYLITACGESEEQAEIYVGLITKGLNRTMAHVSKSYSNLFLFDDYVYACNYTSDLRRYLKKHACLDKAANETIGDLLDKLLQYYERLHDISRG